jgi:hypothetical protein
MVLKLVMLAMFATPTHGFLPPKQIDVCGKKVAIVLVKTLGVDEYDNPVLGFTGEGKISLVEGRPDSEMAETLSHEIMHVILTVKVSGDKTTHHDFIYKLSPCYVDTIFHSNPDLLVYFIGAGYHMKLPQEQKIVPTTPKK